MDFGETRQQPLVERSKFSVFGLEAGSAQRHIAFFIDAVSNEFVN